MYRITIIKLVLLSLGLGTGFNWTIRHKGEQFQNIHQDPDYVRTECGLDRICVPLTFSDIHCNLLNQADTDIKVR